MCAYSRTFLQNFTLGRILSRFYDFFKLAGRLIFEGVWRTATVQGEGKKGKGSPYSIAERRVPELIPVLGS